MGPLEWLRSRLFGQANRKTLPEGTVRKQFGVYPAASRVMEDNINLWWDMYVNHPPWETCDVRPLGLPGAIGRELARHVFAEFDMTVSGGARGEFLQRQMEAAKKDFPKDLELGLCLGGVALKPYRDGDRLLVDASTTNFTPTRFDGAGKAIGGVFKTGPVRQDNGYFVKLEYHDFQQTEEGGAVYVIRSKAFQSDQSGGIGREVSLDSVPEWAGIEPEVYIADLTGPLFAYFKPPEANNVDPCSPVGVSIYAKPVPDLIRQADEQWEMLCWEYRSGERKIITDGGTLVSPRQLDDRLFLKGAFTPNADLFKEFSPEFRDDSLYKGFQHILQRIEFNVGLAYGTLSDPQSVEKTATEILTAKHRQYVTEGNIQKAFQAALDDLLYAMDALCTLFSLAPKGDYQAEYSWGDGVLDDPDTRRQDMAMDMQLVREKLMSRKAFVMKWEQVDDKTAGEILREIDADGESVEPQMVEVE